MATTTTLILGFDTAAGTKKFKYKYVNPSAATSEQIKSAMDVIIANGDIFRYPPLARASAEIETTTSTTINVQ